MTLLRRFSLLALLLLAARSGVSQKNGILQLESEIPLSKVTGRIDHLSVDLAGKRLFVSALGNGTVEIVDLGQGRATHQIPGLKEPQGVLFVEDNDRLYVASGGDGTLRIFDGQTFAPLASLNLGDDADNLRYDRGRKEILVGYGNGKLAGFDLNSRKTFEVKLPAHPESFQVETSGPHIFVNLPGDFSTQVIDRQKASAVGKWRTAGLAANFPMAFDEEGKRLFVGFRLPARLVVYNTETGKKMADLPLVGDSDDLFYDREEHCVYAIGGEGFVDVFRQIDPDRYERIDRVKTASGARTGLFVPIWNRLFVAAPRKGSLEARILVYRVGTAHP